MSSDVTITPKERVNITYKAATGDAVEEQELPLKLLVVGDFKQQPDSTLLKRRVPESINKDNFNSVLNGMGLGLKLKVPNKLAEGDGQEELGVNLAFKGIRDFEPDNIAEAVPELRQLLELRRALLTLKGPLGDVPAFRKAIQDVIQDPDKREKLLKELEAVTTSATP